MIRTLFTILFLTTLVLLTILLSGGEGEAGGTTITVDDDGGPGEADFQRIQDAIEFAQSGDTIEVAGGTYYENVVINKSISIRGDPDDIPIVIGLSTLSQLIVQANDVAISHVDVMNTGSIEPDFDGIFGQEISNLSLNNVRTSNTIRGLYFINCSGIQVENCSSRSNTYGISIIGSSNVALTGCNLSGNQFTGAYFSASVDTSITNCSFLSNNHSGLLIYFSNSTTIKGSEIHGYERYGIYLNDVGPGTVISDNRISGTASSAISINGNLGGVIIRNSISTNIGTGISLRGMSLVSQQWIISENTIHDNNYGMYLSSCENNQILNNTIANNSIGIYIAASSAKDNVFRNNSIFDNSWGMDVYNSYIHSVDAILNWWGDDSGPFHSTKNPEGKGNRVDSFVNFNPWIGNVTKPIHNVDQDEYYASIYHAVERAESGDTIRVTEGLYYESRIIIDKPLTLVGNGNTTTTITPTPDTNNASIIDGDHEGSVFIIEAHGVTISGFIIQGSGTKGSQDETGGAGIILLGDNSHIFGNDLQTNQYLGIKVSQSSGHIIENNTFTGNQMAGYYSGIALYSSNGTTIMNNSFTYHSYGISLSSSPDNEIASNTFYENSMGIIVDHSDALLIHNNSIFNNTQGLVVLGSEFLKLRNNAFTNGGLEISGSTNGIRDWIHDIDRSNTADGQSIEYHVNGSGIDIPSGSTHVILVNCNNVTIQGLDFDHERISHTICLSSDIQIRDNKFTNGTYYLNSLQNERLIFSNNVLMNNDLDFTISHCSNSSIHYNTIQNNSDRLRINWSDNTTFIGNHYLDFPDFEIRFYHSDHSLIIGNTVSMLTLYRSSHSSIIDNHCSFDRNYGSLSYNGIEVRFSHDNILSYNFCTVNSRGIFLEETTDLRLDNNTITESWFAGIQIDSSDRITIENNRLLENRIGIRLSQYSRWIEIHNNTILENVGGIVVFDHCRDVDIRYNTIVDNHQYGVEAYNNEEVVNATYNFWGDDRGPWNEEENPVTNGDNVSLYVNFDPWLNSNMLIHIEPEPDDSDLITLKLLLFVCAILIITIAIVLLNHDAIFRPKSSSPSSSPSASAPLGPPP